jgi:peptidyl-prolyl cis-trans isomerase C
MSKKLIPFLLATSAIMAGCNQQPANTDATATPAPAVATPAPAAEAPVAKEDAVAIVNGVAISKATLKTLEDEIAMRTQGQSFPKKQLLEELIQRQLLMQDAQKKHLDQSVELKEKMNMAEQSLLSQADLQDFLKTNPITDADLKAIYDKEVVAKMSGTEYKARHILVKTEDEAKKLIAELGKGAKFEDLAKKHSLDPSKDQGGDLGWFSAGQMVEPFSKAVEALEKGKYTQAPVQTQFGWHVILREDSRAQTPPAFDAVKEQIRPMAQQQKVQAMLENLRKEAKVEILIPLEEPKAEDKKPAAAENAPAANADAAKPAEAAPATASEAPKADATAPATETPNAAAPADKAAVDTKTTTDSAAKTEPEKPAADKAASEATAKTAEPAKK